jgi:hypothetical protein
MNKARLPLIFGLLAVAAGLCTAQPAPAEKDSRVAERLAALDPKQPDAYLALAEEIADTRADAALVDALLFHAVEQGSATPAGHATASGACLALAERAKNPADRERYIALSGAFDGTSGPALALETARTTKAARAAEASIDAKVATLVGLARSGDGGWARTLLRQPEVADRLKVLDRVITRSGAFRGAAGVEAEVQRWPCTVCGNRRFDKRSASGDGAQARACPNCKGKPGPSMNSEQFVASLRLEAWLLRTEEPGWGQRVAVEGGQPLAEVDLRAIAQSKGIDLDKPLWRDGQWRAPTTPEPSSVEAPLPAPTPTEPSITPVGGP